MSNPMSDYEAAKQQGLTSLKRWEEGIEHHPMSERLMAFLKDHDYQDQNDIFCWKTGGDGDNGECLMFEMDPFFELLERRVREIGEKVSQEIINTFEVKPRRGYSYRNSLKDTIAILIQEQIRQVIQER